MNCKQMNKMILFNYGIKLNLITNAEDLHDLNH